MSSLWLQVFLYSETQVRNGYLYNFLHFRNKLLSVLLVQVDLQKRFAMYHRSFVCQAASKNRGQAFHEDWEQSQDDWERGMTQSCLPSPDHRNPWNR